MCVCARACVYVYVCIYIYIYISKVKRHCIEKRNFVIKNAVSVAPFPKYLCTNTVFWKQDAGLE